MGEIKKHYLVLSFYNAKGNEIKLSIASPVQSVETQTINQIMDKIIELGAFCGSEDINLIQKKSANYLQTEKQDIPLS